ncbi:hypothetical protein CAP39_00440 [Sphingomonas sp. IBVSS1]|nr:hypothetical protein CAP39_00440 [Sphingomonas sp. IBVSS1]
MPPIIYFNIGWMKHYAGAHIDDPTVGGHGWLANHKHGFECFNYLPTSSGMVQGHRPPGASEKTNINQLGAKPRDESIDGVLVVWLAREPLSGKTLVVGWYRDATVYRQSQTGAFNLYGMSSEYSVTTDRRNAFLVPVGARSFQVLSSRKAPGEGFGQKPTWYGAPTVNKRVLAYVDSWLSERKKVSRTSGGNPPRNTDPELRRKVEAAAVKHAWNYYETKYGQGCVKSVESFGRGWDLEVETGDSTLLVEVKGLLNHAISCELTPNEYEKMLRPENRARYVVYVVNNALADAPNAPVPSIFNWVSNKIWQTEDGRQLQITEKVGAVLNCF